MSLTNPPKALLFDIFGTVVDWRLTVTRELKSSASHNLSTLPEPTKTKVSQLTDSDWGRLAQQWRESYYGFVLSYDPQKPDNMNLDDFHASSLKDILQKWDLAELFTADEMGKLSMMWHYLDPWEDSTQGLELLNQKFITGMLSNGHPPLLEDLAKFGPLPFQRVFSAEQFGAFKPHPNVYNGARDALGLEKGEVALVAAHLVDLEGAKRCGYQTIYVERPQEEPWDAEKVEEAKGWVDMWVSVEQSGITAVAKRFGIEPK